MSTPIVERELLNSQPRHRWTVAEYHRMAEVGLLNEDSRVELIDGEIIEMAPIGIEHAVHNNHLLSLLAYRGCMARRSLPDKIRWYSAITKNLNPISPCYVWRMIITGPHILMPKMFCSSSKYRIALSATTTM